MNSRIIVIGFIGGLGCALALALPMAGVMPGNYASTWPRVAPALGTLGYALAVLIASATGWFAVRRGLPARDQSTLIVALKAGATSGAIAGMVAFMGIVAGMAGVVGHAPIFEHGAHAAGTGAAFSGLLGEVMVRVFWWQHIGLWSCWLVGIVLGMLGATMGAAKASVAAGTDAARPFHPTICRALAMWFLIATAVLLVINDLVFIVMQQRVENSVRSVGYTLSHPTSIIFDWPVITELALLALAVWWNWQWPARNWMHPDVSRQRYSRLIAAITVGLSLGSILLCQIATSTFLGRPLTLLGVAALLAAHVVGFLGTRRSQPQPAIENSGADAVETLPALRDWLDGVLPAWLLMTASWASSMAVGVSISIGILTWIPTLTPNKPGADRSLIILRTVEGTMRAIFVNQWTPHWAALLCALVFLAALWFSFTWLPQRRLAAKPPSH